MSNGSSKSGLFITFNLTTKYLKNSSERAIIKNQYIKVVTMGSKLALSTNMSVLFAQKIPGTVIKPPQKYF